MDWEEMTAMRLGLWLPIATMLLSGCATEAALTTASTPDATPLGLATPQSAALPTAVPSTTGSIPGAAPTATAPGATPVTLSRSQANAIHDALWRVLEDPAWVKVGSYNAGVDPAGVVVVCGAYNTRNSFGTFSGMKPFRGEFRGTEFKPGPVAGGNNVTSATLASCDRAGLPIKLQGS